jgi:flagellar protein FlaI
MASGIPAMGTMHSGRVEDVIHRLETPPINLSPSLVDTLDLIVIMVHAREKGESARRVKEIVEIESVDMDTGKARTNSVYRWSPSEDTFEYRGTSWLLQQISARRGFDLNELTKEIGRRKKVLEWMKKKKITNFKEVAKIFTEYRRSPERILKEAGIN